MLKIKDKIDLKELEKFGFKHWKTIWKENENSEDINEWCYDLKFTDISKEVQVLLLQIDDEKRIIQEYIDQKYEMYCIVKETRLNILYDLIQAGLVEKVGD